MDMNVDTNPESTSLTITAQRGHVQALAFARKGGAALSALLDSIAKRKEEERRGPAEMFLFLETNYTEGEQSAIPVVGSKQGETGNKPYDKYTSEVQTKDGKKKVPGSWFTDAVRATDAYARAIDIKSWCDDIKYVNESGAECPEYIVNMGTGERAVEKQRMVDWIKNMRTGLTKGAMLFHHVAEISTLNPSRIRVKMPFRNQKNLTTGENEVVVIGDTIRLQDPDGEIEDKIFSVSQFNALRPAKLEGKPETWTTTALEKTADRAPKNSGKGKGGKDKIAIPTTVEGLLNMFNIISTAIDTTTDQGKMLHSKLLSACAAPGDKGDDVVETVGDFVTKVDDDVWTVINARYNGIKTKKSQALNQKAALQNKSLAS